MLHSTVENVSRKSEPKFLGERGTPPGAARALKTNRRDSRLVPRLSRENQFDRTMRSYCAHVNASHSPTRALRIQARHVEEEHNARVKIIAIQKSPLSRCSFAHKNERANEFARERKNERERKKPRNKRPKNQNVSSTHHQNAHFLL